MSSVGIVIALESCFYLYTTIVTIEIHFLGSSCDMLEVVF